MSKPSYLKLAARGQLEPRLKQALALLTPCRLCPRACGVDRLAGETGLCRIGRQARVASYHAHFGEEPPLVGRHRSGTIFFSGCNLLCSFCQNYEISHLNEDAETAPEELAGMMLELAARGCHNINFVTPTHVVPQILEALPIAVEQGLNIPLVYNSGGYDSVEPLRLLDGIFDIYMPDFKFWDEKWAQRYCHASDYREKAGAALKEMYRQVGNLQLDTNGIAVRGLLVRHLVMANGVAGSAPIMEFLSRELSPGTYLNIMAQYHPCGTAHRDEFINRRVLAEEVAQAIRAARQCGLKCRT